MRKVYLQDISMEMSSTGGYSLQLTLQLADGTYSYDKSAGTWKESK